MAQDKTTTSDHLKAGARLAWSRFALPFRLLTKLSRAALVIMMICFFFLSLALPVITTLSYTAFAVVSTLAGVVTSVPSVLSRQSKAAEVKLVGKEASLVSQRAEAKGAQAMARKAEAKAAAAMQRAIEARLAEQALTNRVTALEAELATKVEASVIYRNEKRLLSEAVADTSSRVALRIKNMLAADISSMTGQAIPYLGAAAIVGSISYDAYQSCEMVKELHDLDVAFNPEHAIVDATQVCGTRVPTASEVWESAKNAPAAALSAAEDALPDFQWEAGWIDLMGHVPSAGEVATTAGQAMDAIGSWLPTFYWKVGWDDLTSRFGLGTSP